jgi:pimeloyl-ACP methyl ester carboxylesterase
VLVAGYLTRHEETARRRVRGVVLASTPLVHHGLEGRFPVQARLVTLGMQLAVENSLVDRWFGRDAGTSDVRSPSYRLIRTGFGPEASPRDVLFVRDMAASVPPHVRADTFRAMRGFDLREGLPAIRVPALVTYGRHDRLVPPEESRLLASLLPRARVEEFADAGHAPFLESPEAFNRLVGRFAARRLARRREPARVG